MQPFRDLWRSTGLLKTNRKQRATRSLFRTVASEIIMNSATPFESNPNGVWAAQPEWFLVGTDNSRPLVASCMPIWNDRYSISAHGAAHLIEMPMHEMTDSAIALEHILQHLFRTPQGPARGGIAKPWHFSARAHSLSKNFGSNCGARRI